MSTETTPPDVQKLLEKIRESHKEAMISWKCWRAEAKYQLGVEYVAHLLYYIRILEKEHREMRDGLAAFAPVLEAWANDPSASGERFLRLRSRYENILSSLTLKP